MIDLFRVSAFPEESEVPAWHVEHWRSDDGLASFTDRKDFNAYLSIQPFRRSKTNGSAV